MRHGRAHWFARSELNDEQLELYDHITHGPHTTDPLGRGANGMTDDEGRLEGPHNVRLYDPKVGGAINALAETLRFDIQLSPRGVEACVLETVLYEQADFAWTGHVRRAKKLGFEDADIAAIEQGDVAPNLTDEEELIRRVTREMLTTRGLSDELFAEAKQVLGEVGIFEVVSLIGHFQHTALSLRVWQVPPRRPKAGSPTGA